MEPGTVRASSSGLEFKLHPLVLINISDHHMRMKANHPEGAATPVLGCLLGSQPGRVVDISNSFEMKFSSAATIDRAFVAKKQEQYKTVFPKLEVLGWYITGAQLEPLHLELHTQMSELYESPLLLLLDPAIRPGRKELPVTLYESEVHLREGGPRLDLVAAGYSVETSEAERIAVDQVAKIVPGGKSSSSEQLTAHLGGLHSAITMLTSQLRAVVELLEGVQSGDVPYPHALLREVAALVSGLPALETPAFKADYLKECNDTLATIYLAAITKGVASANEVVDKVGMVFDKVGRGGRSRARGIQCVMTRHY